MGDTGGNDDDCTTTWTTGCGIEFIRPICDCYPSYGAKSIAATSDNSIAAESGDVYFLSPEALSGGQGTRGERNLYFSSNGDTHYVTTLTPGSKVNRIQVSPDGAHMAFVTDARLTPYDNSSPSGICTPAAPFGEYPQTGPRCLEMYTYEPSSKTLKCVSCLPDGTRPESDIEGSLNGLFMTDDGRAFFSTEDALVPQDTNGLIDVYEFVENRPQLISAGTGSVDRSKFQRSGLVSVSADGVDAYFSTLDTLVGQDTNGQYFKIYDARTGGGFPFIPPAAPCAAADECHGPSSVPPSAIATGTTESLGSGGNLAPNKKKKSKKKKHKKKHKQKRRSQKSTRDGMRR
jgi:hypothetical protein